MSHFPVFQFPVPFSSFQFLLDALNLFGELLHVVYPRDVSSSRRAMARHKRKTNRLCRFKQHPSSSQPKEEPRDGTESQLPSSVHHERRLDPCGVIADNVSIQAWRNQSDDQLRHPSDKAKQTSCGGVGAPWQLLVGLGWHLGETWSRVLGRGEQRTFCGELVEVANQMDPVLATTVSRSSGSRW